MKKLLIVLLFGILLIGCAKQNVDLNEKEKIYYEFGQPTTSSSLNYQDIIESSNSKVFVKSENDNLSVCIYINKVLECFENDNYNVEIPHLESVIGKDNCNLDEAGVHCLDGDFYCDVYFDNKVYCLDIMNSHDCTIDSDNNVICN